MIRSDGTAFFLKISLETSMSIAMSPFIRKPDFVCNVSQVLRRTNLDRMAPSRCPVVADNQEHRTAGPQK